MSRHKGVQPRWKLLATQSSGGETRGSPVFHTSPHTEHRRVLSHASGVAALQRAWAT